MKKILSLFTVLMLLASPAFCAWNASLPAGSSAAADIDTLLNANQEAAEDTVQNMRGWVNLKVVRDSVTQVTVTADELWLQKSGDLSRNFSTVSEAIAITTSGASGLDTGAEANVWYYIWIIAKDDNTINGLLSASATAPTMPADYTYKTLVSAVHNTSGDFVNFIDEGREYTYVSALVPYSGTAGGSFVAIDLTEYIPSSLSTIGRFTVASSATYYYLSNSSSDANGVKTFTPSGFYDFVELGIITANTVYVKGESYAGTVQVLGFTKNKL